MFVLLRYIRKLAIPEILQQPQAHIVVSLSCVLYLISSLDLVDPRIASHDIRSKVLQRSHELHLYANDHWFDHLLALAGFRVGSLTTRNGLLPLRQSLETFTDHHNKLASLKGHGIQDDSELVDSQLQDFLNTLGVSMAVRTLLNKLSIHRRNASVDGSLPTKTDCMHPKPSCVSCLILSPCAASSDRHYDHTLLLSMRMKYQTIVEDLMKTEEPTNSLLCHFQAHHGSGAFLCRYRSCPRATQGFGSSELRQKHEDSHIPQFRCTLIDCGFFGRTFKTRAAMNKHTRQYHDKGDTSSMPDFLPGRLPRPSQDSSFLQLESPISDSQNKRSRRAEASMGDVGNYLADLNLEDLPSHFKDEHDDWHVVYNPAVSRDLSLDNVSSISSQSLVSSICFSPDDKFIACGYNHEAKIFQALTGLAEATLRHTGHNVEKDIYVRGLLFDRTIRTWCTDSGREELQLSNADSYTSVTFSSDGLLLAGASLDKSIRVWIAQTGQLIAHLSGGRGGMVMDKTLLDGYPGCVCHVAFNMHGTALFSASLDKTVKIWEGLQITDDDANMTVKTLRGHKVYYNHPSYLLVWTR